MNVTKLLLCIVAGFAYNPIWCEEVVVMFMKPFPITAETEEAQEEVENLRQPGTIDHHIMRGIFKRDITAGIPSTFRGYLGVSDHNGETTFPRQQTNPVLYLFVTTRITPNIITENTIHHWELQPNIATDVYKAEQKTDEFAGLSFWDVQKTVLPPDNRVPENGIIIFANPAYVFIPSGITLARNDKPNLILPDIYIKKDIQSAAESLYVLNIRHFFGPVTEKYQQRPTSYSSLVVPHPEY